MTTDFTDAEKLMYRIIAAICETDAPIIFEGALVTKLILADNKFIDISRKTADIDASWIGNPPTMPYLVETINRSLSAISENLIAEAKREYGKGVSAGLKIVDTTLGETVTTMDIDIKPAKESKLYYFGEFTIKGALPTEILADKISVISQKTIFRRAKDLVDVYALAHCVEIRLIDIYESHQRNGRTLGDFSEFNTRIHEIRHSYEKLRGIENKPDFESVYQYLSKFIKPFVLNCKNNELWNPKTANWSGSPLYILQTESKKVLSAEELLKQAQMKADKHNEQRSNQKRIALKENTEHDLL